MIGDTINSIIGKKIRRIRKDIGLTQKEIADKLGITDSGFAQLERGDNLISIEHLVKLPSILGCRITDLLPDSVVTDYDRARASDPRLRDLIEWWEIIDDSAREQVYDSARFMTKNLLGGTIRLPVVVAEYLTYFS